MDFTMDASEVAKLAIDLGKAGRKATLGAAAVIEHGALNIKNGMRRDFTGHRYAPAIPRAINYDVRGLSAEIGVDKRGPQGGLGNILAFGTSKNAAVVDHTAALVRETPNIEKFLADVGVGALTTGSASEMIEYTTKAGKTRMASQAQVDNWTRGAR